MLLTSPLVTAMAVAMTVLGVLGIYALLRLRLNIRISRFAEAVRTGTFVARYIPWLTGFKKDIPE